MKHKLDTNWGVSPVEVHYFQLRIAGLDTRNSKESCGIIWVKTLLKAETRSAEVLFVAKSG